MCKSKGYSLISAVWSWSSRTLTTTGSWSDGALSLTRPRPQDHWSTTQIEISNWYASDPIVTVQPRDQRPQHSPLTRRPTRRRRPAKRRRSSPAMPQTRSPVPKPQIVTTYAMRTRRRNGQWLTYSRHDKVVVWRRQWRTRLPLINTDVKLLKLHLSTAV
jgi:hypothetical protein